MRALVIHIIIILLSFGSFDTVAQSFSINLSPKHLSKIEKGKTVNSRLKRYHKFYRRDSTRQIRKLNKLYDRRMDSTYRAFRKEEKLRRLAERRGLKYIPPHVRELSSVRSLDPASTLREKRLDLDQDQLSEQLPPEQREQLQKLESEYGSQSPEVSKYLTLLRDSVGYADSLKNLALGKAETMANAAVDEKIGDEVSDFKEVKKLEEQMKAFKSTPEQYKAQVAEYTDKEHLQDEAKEELKEKAAELIQKNAEPIQKKMGLLKNKYSSLLNSNDLSTGVKARSLKGRPLRERWVIGGNFNIPGTSPLMLDLSPQFGYRVDKTFQVGVGGVYRATFTDSVKVSKAPPASVYGYSIFSSHSVVWNFFAYAEWERANALLHDKSGDVESRQWVDNVLVGVGRQFAIHRKLKASVLFLWNPLHENGMSTYHDAFVIKTGLHLSELALLKR